MATSLAKATAAPIHITLGKKEYRVSPLRDADYGEYEVWVQDRFVSVAKRTTKDLEPEERDSILKDAVSKAGAMTISSPEALRLMGSVEGAAMLMYLSIRRRHPDITYDEMVKLLTDPENLEYAMEKYDTLMGPEKTPKKGGLRKKRVKKRVPTRRQTRR